METSVVSLYICQGLKPGTVYIRRKSSVIGGIKFWETLKRCRRGKTFFDVIDVKNYYRKPG